MASSPLQTMCGSPLQTVCGLRYSYIAIVAIGLVFTLMNTQVSARHFDTCECAFCGGDEFATNPPKVGNTHVEEPNVDGKPFPPKDDSHVRNDTSVMVLLSAYRDPRCGQTVANVFLRATHPSRMHVGIVQQKEPIRDKFDCLALYCAVMEKSGQTPCPYLENIQIVTVDARKAQGPIWARGIGQPMIKDSHQFCMQVDAHVDFMTDYDTHLMKMWSMTENEYGVLSTYVGNLGRDLSQAGEVLVGHPFYQVPVICGTIKGGHGVMRNKQAFGATCLEKPLLSFTWAAGWSFAKCHFERNAPNDPQMGGMFDGEEFSRYIRSWTKGYDTYTPHRPIVFHDYNHSHRFQRGREGTWNSNPANIEESVGRYFTGVDAPNSKKQDLGGWGIGDRRSLDQYVEFSGIDARKSQDLNQNKCGKLKFVPFEEDLSLIETKMPELPFDLPGTMEEGSDRKEMPTSLPEHVEDARIMRTILVTDEPEISHKQQVHEFGEPNHQFWSDMIAAVRAEKNIDSLREKENEQQNIEEEHQEQQDRQEQEREPRDRHEEQQEGEQQQQVEEEQEQEEDAFKNGEEDVGVEDEEVLSVHHHIHRHVNAGWTVLQMGVVVIIFYAGVESAKQAVKLMKNSDRKKSAALIA